MQITFDPLDKREADYVRDMLGASTQTLTIGGVSAELTSEQMAALLEAGIEHADRPDVGAEAAKFAVDVIAAGETSDPQNMARIAQSAAPLPQDPYLEGLTNRNAPLPAAADLFSTAPAAPPAFDLSGWTAPPPPVPPAPVAVVPPAPAAAPSPVDVDKFGLPWDDRIHAGTKAKNADGSWRQRRGVDEAIVKSVEAELRALLALSQIPNVTTGSVESADPLVPPVTTTIVPTPPTAVGHAPSATEVASSVSTPPPPVPVAPARAVSASVDAGNVAPVTSPPATAPIPTPPVPPAPIAAAGGAALTFADLMKRVVADVTSKAITESQVHDALATVGLGPNEIGKLSALDKIGDIQRVAAYFDTLTGGV